MVNRETNFNRKYVKKLKKVRDIRKSKTGNKRKGKVTVEKKPEGYEKKMLKRQDRFNKICGSLNIKKGEIFKRRPKKQKAKKEKDEKNKMEIE
jgi:hypothetical protein